MGDPIRIVLFEDQAADAELIVREMRKGGLDVVPRRVDTREALEQALREHQPDIILSDYSVPGFDGLDALAFASEHSPQIPFIFVSGTIGEERAIDALKRGATDYVLKDNRARLVSSIRRALAEAEERRARRRAEDALQASEQRFRSIAEATQEWIWETDAAAIHTYCNPAVEAILGYSPAEVIGRSVLEFIDPDDQQNATGLLHDCHADRHGWRNRVLRWRHQEGGVRWLESNGLPLVGAGGEVVGYRGANRDITERILQEEKIARLSRIRAVLGGINATLLRVRDRTELFREACRIAVDHGNFRLAWIGLAESDAPYATPVAWAGHEDGYLLQLSSALRDLAGRETDEPWMREDPRLFVVNDLERDPRVLLRQESLARGYRSMVKLPLAVENERIGVLALYAAEPNFFDQNEIKLLKDLAADISLALTHIARDEKLAFISYYDPLTGLANRQLLFDRLTQIVNAAGRERRDAAVVRIDLQRFRNINDTLGRSAGDDLLRQLAGRLQKIFPDTATVARVGGDHFAVAVADLRGPALAQLFEAWMGQFASEPFAIEGMELRVAVKIGIALFPADGATADTLFANAEAALRRAKDGTDTYTFYSPEMNHRVAERLHRESRLREAVATKQFIVHYQPKVDLASRRLCGFEALLRWRDPEHGWISPAEFVGVLEETGMIIDVGRWVIEQVVADSQAWRGQGLAVPRIAVNVSQAQLVHKDFVGTVFAALGTTAREAINVDLEITESMFMKDAQECAEKLGALRATGIRVFIDDFGTGYSNLSQLAKLPIDAVKIDRSFVTRIVTHAQDRAIVSTIINLAQAMNVAVVAEGVETEEQAGLLHALGCDEAQGELFGRAQAVEDIVAMLAAASVASR